MLVIHLSVEELPLSGLETDHDEELSNQTTPVLEDRDVFMIFPN
jgi:hypothetical protein